MAAPLPALPGAAGSLPGAVLPDVVTHLMTSHRSIKRGVSEQLSTALLLNMQQLQNVVAAHLFELLIGEAVELDDELAVSGRDLSTGVNDLDDVELLSQAHLCADLPAQVLDVLHLAVEIQFNSALFKWHQITTTAAARHLTL